MIISPTVLLSTYNGARYLPDQLDSLFAQAWEDFTVLARDDGSTDGTLEILGEYRNKYPGKITVLGDSPGNLGAAKSFMRLLDLAEGGYFMFCDQDDIWMPDKIEKTVRKMEELEAAHGSGIPLLVFSDLAVADTDLRVVGESLWKSQRLDPGIASNWKKVCAQNVVTGCTMMINAAAKKACLPFPDIGIMYDQWIAINCARAGRVARLDAPTVLYRQHRGNAVGAVRPGVSYAAEKIMGLCGLVSFYSRLSAAMGGEITVPGLMMRKLVLNLKRMV
jgi:glycosyltransferase involved in cell wall biosynthesis